MVIQNPIQFFFSSDNKCTVPGIVSVSSWMTEVFPVRVLIDLWLWD